MGLKLCRIMEKRLRASIQRTRRLIVADGKRVLKLNRNREGVIAPRKRRKEGAVFLLDIEQKPDTQE